MSAPGDIRVGLSGRTHHDWEPLWPVAGDNERLALLARTFGVVEFDTPHFATPARRTVERWASDLVAGLDVPREPAGCQAIVQVPVDLLHDHAPPAAEVERFRDALAPLRRGRRLGALLARFDAGFLHGPREVRRLARIAFDLDGLPLCAEVLHPSWWEPGGLEGLAGAGWSLAHVDAPSELQPRPRRHWPTGPIGLLRLHGRRLALYPPPAVGELARRATAIAAETDACFVVAANVDGGAALATAFELRWLLEGQRPLAPWTTLVARFPHLAALGAPGPPEP